MCPVLLTASPYCVVTLLQCYFVTVLLCYRVTLLLTASPHFSPTWWQILRKAGKKQPNQAGHSGCQTEAGHRTVQAMGGHAITFNWVPG